MSRQAEFYRALDILCHRASAGDKHAEAVLDDLVKLAKNVSYALQAGDEAHAAELLTDAHARALLRSAFDSG